MSAPFIKKYLDRAQKSIKELNTKGKTPVALEISSDIWMQINCMGINRYPGKKIFAGLNVIERNDLKDHIKAIDHTLFKKGELYHHIKSK